MTQASVSVHVRGDAPYVIVDRQRLGPRPRSVPSESVARVAIIHPPTLRATADVLREDLAAAGKDAITIEIPDGEKAKASDVAAYCWSVLGQSSFTRTDLIIGLGGGATTDLAGFVAATWLRGVPLIQVPTTLLAMVDAAVGGKTGINTEEGKNLVGAFYPPELVICDLATLGLHASARLHQRHG